MEIIGLVICLVVTTNAWYSTWMAATGAQPVTCPAKNFIRKLGVILAKFADDTKLKGITDPLESRGCHIEGPGQSGGNRAFAVQ